MRERSLSLPWNKYKWDQGQQRSLWFGVWSHNLSSVHVCGKEVKQEDTSHALCQHHRAAPAPSLIISLMVPQWHVISWCPAGQLGLSAKQDLLDLYSKVPLDQAGRCCSDQNSPLYVCSRQQLSVTIRQGTKYSFS